MAFYVSVERANANLKIPFSLRKFFFSLTSFLKKLSP